MEHWDHHTCEAFNAFTGGIASAVSGMLALCIVGAIGFGLI